MTSLVANKSEYCSMVEMSVAEILADFLDLEPEDIQASLECAAAKLNHPVFLVTR